MSDLVSTQKKKSRTVLFATVVVWISLFTLSIIAAAGTEPTGDGFTRGMNRTMVFLKWQVAALVVSLISFFMARGKTTDLSTTLQFIGKTPLYTHCVILIFVVGVIIYAILTN